MKVIKIPKKKKGEFRTIYVQNKGWEKKKYQSLALILEDFYFSRLNNECVQGFIPGRNCVTNAQKHLNKDYTLTVDLKDFFDHVDAQHLISQGIDRRLAEEIMYEGRARQGLSSSPMAANIAANSLDKKILSYLEDFKNGCVYTRYADDLTFSCNDVEFLKQLRSELEKLVVSCGFKINPKKTRIQCARYGRRVITGIAIDDKCHATRSNKRKVRALKHKLKYETVQWKIDKYQRIINGLEEFNKCKLPNEKNKKERLNLMFWQKHLLFASDRLLKPDFLNKPYFKNNVQRKRDLLHRVGIERCLQYLEQEVLDTYHNYQLIEIDFHPNMNTKDRRFRWQRTKRRYLKMQNPSVEGMFHIEGVDPRCSTVQEAINFRRYGNLNNSMPPWSPIILS